MKKKFLFAAVTISVAFSTAIGVANSNSKTISALEAANIEALSQYEIDITNCKGCSTYYTFQYCCSILGKDLYRY